MEIWQSRSLAPTAVLLLAIPAVAQPDFVTAPVTAQMAVAAVDECALQLRAPAFDHQRLTQAGWVDAIRSDGDDLDIVGYRHPRNMILLNIFDSANGADRCLVMAPTGRGLDMESLRAALRERLGDRPAREGDRSVWELDDLVLVLAPMGPAGVIVEIDRRSGHADSPSR